MRKIIKFFAKININSLAKSIFYYIFASRKEIDARLQHYFINVQEKLLIKIMLRLFNYKETNLNHLVHELQREKVIEGYVSWERLDRFNDNHDYQILEWDKFRKERKVSFWWKCTTIFFFIYYLLVLIYCLLKLLFTGSFYISTQSTLGKLQMKWADKIKFDIA